MVVRQDEKTLDEVFKLSDVARPIVLHKTVQEFGGEPLNFAVVALAIICDERLRLKM